VEKSNHKKIVDARCHHPLTNRAFKAASLTKLSLPSSTSSIEANSFTFVLVTYPMHVC
jgi:hypothetical protein